MHDRVAPESTNRHLELTDGTATVQQTSGAVTARVPSRAARALYKFDIVSV